MSRTVSGTAGDDSLHAAGGDTVLGGDGYDALIVTDVRSLAFDPIDPTAGTVTFVNDSALFFASIERFLFEGGRDGIVDGPTAEDAISAGFADAGGDAMDAGDAILPGEAGQDDIVEADGGEDTFFSGLGNDAIDGRAGDEIERGAGGDDHDRLIVARGATVTYEELQPERGGVNFADGGTLTFRNIDTVVIPCFTPGTLIQTDRGEVLVEAIVPGDRVLTRDRGYQAVRWVGRRHLTKDDLGVTPHLVPVRIERGALGPDMPSRDMQVSPQQRLLVQGPRTKLLFGETEVLVPALHLIGYPGIGRADVAITDYIHIMCDRHEVIWSDGIWTESFQPGDQTLAGLDAAQRGELQEIFPALRARSGGFAAARRTLRRHEADLLLS
jgi:Hint domain